jgi:hypothetical protein
MTVGIARTTRLRLVGRRGRKREKRAEVIRASPKREGVVNALQPARPRSLLQLWNPIPADDHCITEVGRVVQTPNYSERHFRAALDKTSLNLPLWPMSCAIVEGRSSTPIRPRAN